MAGEAGFDRTDLQLVMAVLLIVAWIAINVVVGVYGLRVSEQFLGALGTLSLFLVRDWLFKGNGNGNGNGGGA